MDTSIIILACVIAGGVGNTLIQFLAAICNSPVPIKFDQKYFASFGISMITVVVAALGVFLTIPVPQNVNIIYIAIPAFLSGYAINNVTNLGMDTYTNKPVPMEGAASG